MKANYTTLPSEDQRVLEVVSLLKDNLWELDGETMQYILEEVGMDEQMHKQLNVKFNKQ